MTATETEKVDISAELSALIAKLGLEYNNVAELRITPHSVTAENYLINEEGSKYVTEDGDIAAESLTFDVTT